MKIIGDWLTYPETQALCLALETSGHRALFVGGCVRNALLGVPVGDTDLATDALPKTVSNIAENAGFKVIPTGIDHGTVTVVAGGRPHDRCRRRGRTIGWTECQPCAPTGRARAS